MFKHIFGHGFSLYHVIYLFILECFSTTTLSVYGELARAFLFISVNIVVIFIFIKRRKSPPTTQIAAVDVINVANRLCIECQHIYLVHGSFKEFTLFFGIACNANVYEIASLFFIYSILCVYIVFEHGSPIQQINTTLLATKLPNESNSFNQLVVYFPNIPWLAIRNMTISLLSYANI